MAASAGISIDSPRAARTSGTQAFKRQKIHLPGNFLSRDLSSLPTLNIESLKMSPSGPVAPPSPPAIAPFKARRSSPGRINPWSSMHASQTRLETQTSMEPATPSVDEDGEVVGAGPARERQIAAVEAMAGVPKGPKTCAQCGSSKTPLWRNGPPGPKSLCNACGIRYNKMKAGKRSRAQVAEDSPAPPASPMPSTPSFRGKGRSPRDGKTGKPDPVSKSGDWSAMLSRKRSRCTHGKYGSPVRVGGVKDEGRGGATSSDEGEEEENRTPTSSGSSSGGSCITRRGRRNGSPGWTSRQAPAVGEMPPALSLKAEVEMEEIPSLSDEKEGAALLMMLFYGVGNSWMHEAVAA